MAILADFMVGLSSSLGFIVCTIIFTKGRIIETEEVALEGCNCHKGVKQRNYFLYPSQFTVRQYQSLTLFLTFLSIREV